MRKFAFITRHTPNDSQKKMAADMDINLVHVGDADAFSVTKEWVNKKGDFQGVVVIHPAAALRLCKHYEVGVFENANRAPEGERPQFKAVKFHIY